MNFYRMVYDPDAGRKDFKAASCVILTMTPEQAMDLIEDLVAELRDPDGLHPPSLHLAGFLTGTDTTSPEAP